MCEGEVNTPYTQLTRLVTDHHRGQDQLAVKLHGLRQSNPTGQLPVQRWEQAPKQAGHSGPGDGREQRSRSFFSSWIVCGMVAAAMEGRVNKTVVTDGHLEHLCYLIISSSSSSTTSPATASLLFAYSLCIFSLHFVFTFIDQIIVHPISIVTNRLLSTLLFSSLLFLHNVFHRPLNAHPSSRSFV